VSSQILASVPSQEVFQDLYLDCLLQPKATKIWQNVGFIIGYAPNRDDSGYKMAPQAWLVNVMAYYSVCQVIPHYFAMCSSPSNMEADQTGMRYTPCFLELLLYYVDSASLSLSQLQHRSVKINCTFLSRSEHTTFPSLPWWIVGGAAF
jgi:hypothetical protein